MEEWTLLGQRAKPYKRVKCIFPSGVNIKEVLDAHKEFLYAHKHLPKNPSPYEGRGYLIELEPIECILSLKETEE